MKCFTADERSIAAYGPLATEDGSRRFTLTFLRSPKPGLAIVRAPEIAHREEAMALAGVRLYAPRSQLPPIEDDDEFYVEDLVGLDVMTDGGRTLGRVAAIHNFGAGDVVEVKQGKSVLYVPFTLTAMPKVDLSARLAVVAEAALSEIDSTIGEGGGEGGDDEQDAMREQDS